MFGEKRGRNDRQRGVLVAGRLDGPRQAMAAFNLELNWRQAHTSTLAVSELSWMNSRRGSTSIAHQLGEDIVGLVDLLDLHLQQRAFVGVERRFPELVRVHFAEALVALQLRRPCGRRR